MHKRNLVESVDPLLLSASSSEVAAPRRAVVEVVTRLITCLDQLQVGQTTIPAANQLSPVLELKGVNPIMVYQLILQLNY